MSKQKRGSSVDKGREKRKQRKKEGKRTRGGKKRNQIEREREKNKKKKRFSRHSDCQSSTVREEKSIHTSRATCGYQNLGVFSNSTRLGIFVLGLFLA